MTPSHELRAPVAMVPAPDGSGHLLLLERGGELLRFEGIDAQASGGQQVATLPVGEVLALGSTSTGPSSRRSRHFLEEMDEAIPLATARLGPALAI